MQQQEPYELLAIRGLTKTFGDTVALNDVDFSLNAGEVHCLVGENGAGKSTLIKILSGAERPDTGRIILFGKEYRYLTPRQSLEMGIATIYQDMELVTSIPVADNIFLGHEIKGKFRLIDYAAQNRQATELMRSMGIDIPATTLVESLSPAEQQTLQIVKALHINARILIMDEPTSSLGVEETKALLNIVRKLVARKIGIIFISHYLREIFEIGDRVTVLKDGQTVGTFEVRNTDVSTITRRMLGRESMFVRQSTSPADPILQVHNLSCRKHFHGITFDLRKGEILGFGGVVGAGRTALMNVLFGSDHRDTGEILLNDRPVNFSSPRDAIAHGIAMIPEDRKQLGLLDLRPVLENIAIVRNERSRFFIHRQREKAAVCYLIDRLHIVSAGTNQLAGSLSGGNQQKAILARWLLIDAQIFIFDEPTKGVDIGAKEQIYRLMVELTAQGKSILMVSSDLPELLALSDRIAVMRNGVLVSILDAKDTTEHQLLGLFIGIEGTEHSPDDAA
ncbi:MAG: sugar ABC transporter ATP-binding protein [Verrucomicrobia bacterium]|nr:sugar ABC transporter ATP-binding protein [Verrucomicrobiota bacterium]MBV8274321.1 sugar ABC transporter ATP-binding protein [Verrucomicrobiota bacterium]